MINRNKTLLFARAAYTHIIADNENESLSYILQQDSLDIEGSFFFSAIARMVCDLRF